MQVILYARFSPRRNAEECESSEHQLADMREYCVRHGHEIVAEHVDDALSGGDYDRPELWNAVNQLRAGQGIMVRQLDRIARDVYLCEAIVREIRKRKGTLLVSHGGGGLEENSHDADMLRQILQAVAERQRKVTAALTKAAMLRKQADGIRMSSPDKLPYGWKLDESSPLNSDGVPTRMIEDPEQQRVIAALVREWTVTHRLAALGALRRGRSLRELARFLNDLRVPTPGGGQTWRHGTVHYVLLRGGAI